MRHLFIMKRTALYFIFAIATLIASASTEWTLQGKPTQSTLSTTSMWDHQRLSLRFASLAHRI